MFSFTHCFPPLLKNLKRIMTEFDFIVTDEASPLSSTASAALEVGSSCSSASDRAWQVIKSFLDLHDGPDTGYAYRRCVVDKLLHMDRFLKLPLWLMNSFKVRRRKERKCLSLRKFDVESLPSFSRLMYQKICSASI